MISLKQIMQQVLTETLSFMDLWKTSDPARKLRSRRVKPRSLGVTSMDGNEAWKFSYKSDKETSTTGMRWQGNIIFLKENVELVDSAKDLQCMTDCSCPDYRFRFSYGNAEQDAGITGPNSLNKNNGMPPKPPGPPHFGMGKNVGLCKHLLSLGEYLRTQWEPVAPEPPKEKEPVIPTQKPAIRPSTPSVPSIPPGTAPEPPKPKPSYYSDTRSGTLMENKKNLSEIITNFIKTHPTFEVTYED